MQTFFIWLKYILKKSECVVYLDTKLIQWIIKSVFLHQDLIQNRSTDVSAELNFPWKPQKKLKLNEIKNIKIKKMLK